MTDYTTFEAPLAHPGEHLREDYLPAYKLTAGALARRAREARSLQARPPMWAPPAGGAGGIA